MNHKITARRGAVQVTITVPIPEAITGSYARQVERYFDRVLDETLDAFQCEEEFGVVKWYDDTKAFGFIRTPSGELFVHRKGLLVDRLLKDQLVRFKRRVGRGTSEAYDVSVEAPDGS